MLVRRFFNFWSFLSANCARFAIDTFYATPGEFPFAVVVVAPSGDFCAGVLTTPEVVLTTCTFFHTFSNSLTAVFRGDIKVIASVGDWINEENRQEKASSFIMPHENCTVIHDITLNNVAALVVNDPFQLNLFVVPVSFREPNDLHDVARMKHDLVRTLESEENEFIIGGFACQNRSCSNISPMLRTITRPLPDEDCLHIICGKDCNEGITIAKMTRAGLLCFPNKEVGGQGSPITYNERVVAFGNNIVWQDKTAYLLATRLDIALPLLNLLQTTSSSALSLPLLWIVPVACNIVFL